MASNVVGLFDDRMAAERAKAELIRQGFSGNDVYLTDRPPVQGQAYEEESFWEKIKDFFRGEDRNVYEEAARRGGTLLSVNVADDAQAERAADIIDQFNPVDVNERAETWRQSGWQGQPQRAAEPAPAARTKASMGTPPKAAQEERIPIVEEQMKVGKRQLRRGVRIYSRVIETPVEEDVRLRDEKVRVERQRVTRPAPGGMPEDALKEKVVDVTEIHEEPVVAKEAQVVEEVVVSKEAAERTERVKGTVRHTEVDVQPLEQEFRRDYESNYASSGASYEELKPAYEYGQRLARDPKNRGRDWMAIESDARREFEQRQPGQWDRCSGAIRRSFERQGSESV